MKNFRLLSLIVLTAIMSFLMSVCASAITWSNLNEGVTNIHYVGPIYPDAYQYVPIGCPAKMGIIATDKDWWSDPPLYTNIAAYSMLNGSANNSYYYESAAMSGNGVDCNITFSKTWHIPLYEASIHVLFNIDDVDKFDDTPLQNVDVTTVPHSWYGPTDDIQGPAEYCTRATNISYCVPVGPTETNTTTGSKIYWYVYGNETKNASFSQEIGFGTYSNGFSIIAMPSLKPGSYLLKARAEDRNTSGVIITASPWFLARSKSVVVDELPADLPKCNEGGGGCSSCSATPDVEPKTGYVSPLSVYSSMAGPHYEMLSLTSNDSTKCSNIQRILCFVYNGCNNTSTIHTHVWNSCGKVSCLNESDWVNDVATLSNGDTLTRTYQGLGYWEIVWRSPDGTYINHTVTYGTYGSDKTTFIQNADGSTTTSAQNGSVYTYKDNPAGGTAAVEHKYTISSGNMTKYQAVNNGVVSSESNLTYDTNNRVTQVVVTKPNEVDKIVTMGYDGSGNLTSVNQNGKITRYTRTTDAQGRLKNTVTIEDAQGTLYGKTEYLFDTYTTTITVKDVQNLLSDQVTTNYYITDSSGNKRYLYKVVDPAGNITVTKVYVPIGYMTDTGAIVSGANTDFYKEDPDSDLWGNPVSSTQLYGTIDARAISYAYDTLGRITSVTYPQVICGVNGWPITETTLTPQQTFGYTGNFMTSRNDPTGINNTYTYSTSGQLTQQQMVRGGITIVTTYTYTAISGPVATKRVVTSSPSSNWLNEYTYYNSGLQQGLLQSETLKDGNNSDQVQLTRAYSYLQNSQVQPGPTTITTTYYSGGTAWRTTTQSASYDAYGNKVGWTDANGKTISISKTATTSQKTERMIYASGIYTETVSDCCKLLYKIGIDGKITNYVYDAIGRVVKTYTNDTGQSETTPQIQNAYDGFGRSKSVTTRSNANTARTTSYTYDNLNHVTAIDNPGNLADELIYYDVYGRLMAKSNGSGRTTMYKYDTLNRPTDIYFIASRPSPLVYPTSTPSIHKIYQGATDMLMCDTVSGDQNIYTTNGLGQLTSVYWPMTGHSMTYTYDAMGRKSSVAFGGNTTNYTYDPMGKLATIKLGTSTIAAYTTDAVGNRTRVDFGNGTWQTFSFGTDARYMPTGIDYAYKCNSGDTITNKGGIRLTRTNGGNPLSWADNTDKFIKTFSYDNQGRLANADIPGVSRIDYGYDWVGNRTSPTAVYNDADQLTSYNGNTYSYNTYGDMTSGAGRTYTTADSGRVWRIAYNGVNYDNAFNANNLRYNTNIGGVSTNYVYDITARIPAVVAETNGSGAVTNYYVREPSGELVMRQNGTDQKYYHFDELGSTLFLTDASGVQTDKYVYNAWGKIVSSAGTTVNPFKYVGRLGYYTDAGTGLILLGSRFYDPDAGMFTQRDTAKDGLSHYRYTGGHPTMMVDPSGQCAALIAPIGGCLVSGGISLLGGYATSDTRLQQACNFVANCAIGFFTWAECEEAPWSCSFILGAQNAARSQLGSTICSLFACPHLPNWCAAGQMGVGGALGALSGYARENEWYDAITHNTGEFVATIVFGLIGGMICDEYAKHH